MPNRDPVIEAYRTADAGKRLYLFMDYPSLRSEFIAIDLGEYRAAPKSNHRQGTAPKRSLPSRWFTALTNCCLKYTRA